MSSSSSPAGCTELPRSLQPDAYARPDEAQLRAALSPLAYQVTQQAATERPFSGIYDRHFERGLYVDVVTGEPLFCSRDKYDSGCGWPAFTRPLVPQAVTEHSDTSHGMVRTEVRSAVGHSHLGHVFDDGPPEQGGRRYCINSAALRFIAYADMEREGYGDLKTLLD